jgi:tetratricopeptide (TPR) repeat protein
MTLQELQAMFALGLAFYRNNTRGDNATARALFGAVLKATETDPNNRELAAKACAQLAATYRQEWNFEWTADDPSTLSVSERRALLRGKEEVALALAEEALEIDAQSPYGHVQLAYLYVYKLEHGEALTQAQEAIDSFKARNLDPAEGYAVKAQVLTYRGDKGDTQAAVDLMLRLVPDRSDPSIPAYYLRQLGQAYYAMENYEDAESYLTEAMKLNPKHRQVLLTLAAVYVAREKIEAARELFKKFPDLELHRHITIDELKLRQQAPYNNLKIKAQYIKSLKTAGSEGETPSGN